MQQQDCDCCTSIGGILIWQDERCRIVRIDDTDYPGYCRVIWATHVREMSDLSHSDREHLMKVVFAVEHAVRSVLMPDKINLASLGNVVPHVHWHVIPRFSDDRHFPKPVWAAPQRDANPRILPAGWTQQLAAAILTELQRESL